MFVGNARLEGLKLILLHVSIGLSILEMVTEIRGMGMEVCTTLGMLSPEQARQLKQAGLTGMISDCNLLTSPYPTQNNGSIQP